MKQIKTQMAYLNSLNLFVKTNNFSSIGFLITS